MGILKIEEIIKKLPPEFQKEVEDFIQFLLEKQKERKKYKIYHNLSQGFSSVWTLIRERQPSRTMSSFYNFCWCFSPFWGFIKITVKTYNGQIILFSRNILVSIIKI